MWKVKERVVFGPKVDLVMKGAKKKLPKPSIISAAILFLPLFVFLPKLHSTRAGYGCGR